MYDSRTPTGWLASCVPRSNQPSDLDLLRIKQNWVVLGFLTTKAEQTCLAQNGDWIHNPGARETTTIWQSPGQFCYSSSKGDGQMCCLGLSPAFSFSKRIINRLTVRDEGSILKNPAPPKKQTNKQTTLWLPKERGQG